MKTDKVRKSIKYKILRWLWMYPKRLSLRAGIAMIEMLNKADKEEV